ncbi:hypothetical protein HHI36_004848 [Cryptolaemus montrouzieri]|uniref:CCHC-type domain-containing protein n=1 Tax=Cryptolaemus montrouzieri TaxID=559131 RepID=A0ABD2NSY8_9CUCU
MKLNNETIPASRLIPTAARFILSNVSPVILHSVLGNEKRNLKVYIVSPMNFLKIGMQDPDYSHILNFRRHVYLSPHDTSEIPESFLVEYDDTQYRIFLLLDDHTCFKCKKPDHVALNCNSETISEDNFSQNILQLTSANSGKLEDNEAALECSKETNTVAYKRTISETSNTTPTGQDTNEDTFTKPKTSKKHSNKPDQFKRSAFPYQRDH